ncbi:MAG: hypothetical protein ACFCBW_05555 [Candidatus Competibacterales bacterium]
MLGIGTALGEFAFYPLPIASVRLAARVADGIFFFFGLFLLFGGGLNPLTLGFALLILGFAGVNLHVIGLSRVAFGPQTSAHRLRSSAHLFSVALPVAFFLGLLDHQGFGVAWSWSGAMAMVTPSLLNGLAIETTLRFNRALIAK